MFICCFFKQLKYCEKLNSSFVQQSLQPDSGPQGPLAGEVQVDKIHLDIQQYWIYSVYTLYHYRWRIKMTTQMIVRINPELKNKVNSLAKSEGKSVSEVVRELLEDYVKNRDIGLYIDDLWQRIGDKLTSRKIGPKDIQRAIQEVRAKK